MDHFDILVEMFPPDTFPSILNPQNLIVSMVSRYFNYRPSVTGILEQFYNQEHIDY